MTTETTTNSNSIETIILEALKQGDKNRGQLFDVTGKNYTVLVQVLQRLKGKGLIETHFVPSGEVSVLTYRLRPKN
ncbi:MAG: hypothetical protein WCA35_28235 [Kovacikia sp.]